MGIIIGGVSARDLIMDGRSVSLYVGGNPPTKVWPTRETVQITLGTGTEARNQLRAALADRGLDSTTVTEIPFDIEFVGTGSAEYLFLDYASLTSAPRMNTGSVTSMVSMFYGCSSLTSVPRMDTSSVTSMRYMFRECSSLTSVPAMDTSLVTDMYAMFTDCSSLTYVPDMDTSSVTDIRYMFSICAALTDGNVRLIGRHPQVDTTGMISGSGLTREPWYTADGRPVDVYEVSLNRVWGNGSAHTLVSVTVPAGETWSVRIQGTVTGTSSTSTYWPHFRIGTVNSGRYAKGATVDFSGTITAANRTIAMVTNSGTNTSFVGTVTIEK